MVLKNIIIGAITTTVLVAGSVLLFNGKQGSTIDTVDDLVIDYQKLSDDVQGSKTDLMNSCKTPGAFNAQIDDLENRLARLRQRKNDIINRALETKEEEYIPRLGEQAPDLGDPGPVEQEEYIPRPGDQAPDLGNPDPVEQEEYIPRLGEQVPDLGDSGPVEQEEYIPRPGDQAPDLGNPDPVEQEEYIPRLGEQVPDLGDPGPVEQEEYIPRPGDQAPDFIENTSILSKINVLEEEIIAQINAFKSICEKEQPEKEIISTSCPDACKKYSECTKYTEDTTQEDRQDAYDSCMIECEKRSDKAKICINKKPIKTVSDCTNLTMCALPEYNNALEQSKTE